MHVIPVEEFEKVAKAGTGKAKVHHYTKSGRPVYQSEMDARAKKGRKRALKGWGNAALVGAGLAAPVIIGRIMGRKAAQHANKKWRNRGREAGKKWAEEVISGLKGVKTKKEAKKKYWAESRKQHPDVGGSEEAQKAVNTAWDDYRNSDVFSKLAMLRGWSDIATALVK